MPVFKPVRWLLTIVFAIVLAKSMVANLSTVAVVGALVSAGALLALWLTPLLMRQPGSTHASQKARGPQGAQLRHDNIALDPATDKLWIRDASGAQRHLSREDLLSWKTAHDVGGAGVCRQRIELDVRDVERPRWRVMFNRHSDRWFKGSDANARERDEWFARVRAWHQAPPSVAVQPKAAGADMGAADFRRHYQQAQTLEDRDNWLVAFEFHCDSLELNPKAEWERLGGAYPGPSAEYRRMGRFAKELA